MDIYQRAQARVQREHRTSYVSGTGTWACSCGKGSDAPLVGSGFRKYEIPPGVRQHLSWAGKQALETERAIEKGAR